MFFLKKTRYTHTSLPAARTRAHVPAYLYPPTREIQISKIPPGSHQINIRTPTRRKKNIKNTLVPVPIVSVPVVLEMGTSMKRAGYNFEKKKNRLSVPAVRRGRTRPIPAVPVSKPLVVMMGKTRVRGVQSG
jgi:hypothetical protein